MASQTINPAAQAFTPRPAPPATPSPSPPRDSDRWAVFTLSSHPGDSSGTIPTSFSTTAPVWYDRIEGVCARGPAEMVECCFSLDACGNDCAKTLLANLAPKWNCTPTSSPMLTYRVRFYTNTRAGMHRMEALHSTCRILAYLDDNASGWATMQLLSRLNEMLGAFDTKPGDLGALRVEIEGVQKWPIEERRRAEMERRRRVLAAQMARKRGEPVRAFLEAFHGKAKGDVMRGGGCGGERTVEPEEEEIVASMPQHLRELNEGSVAEGKCSSLYRAAGVPLDG